MLRRRRSTGYGAGRGDWAVLVGAPGAAGTGRLCRRQPDLKLAPARTFSLVIGADGLHSNVRRLVFGAQDRFISPRGFRHV